MKLFHCGGCEDGGVHRHGANTYKVPLLPSGSKVPRKMLKVKVGRALVAVIGCEMQHGLTIQQSYERARSAWTIRVREAIWTANVVTITKATKTDVQEHGDSTSAPRML